MAKKKKKTRARRTSAPILRDEETLQNMVDQAVERSRDRDEEDESDMPSLETLEEVTDSDDMDDPEQAMAFDIFTDAGDQMIKGGFRHPKTGKLHKGIPKYTIKKNGAFHCTKGHPYSIERLQDDEGGGHYTIICKNSGTGEYVITQSITLSEPEHEEEDVQTNPYQAPVSDHLSMKEMMLLMAEKEEKARREARESAETQTTMVMGMMTNMTQMMMASQKHEPAQNPVQDMMFKMMEKQMEGQNRLIERLNDKLERLSDAGSKKSDTIDSLKLVQLLKESEKSGIDKYKEILELSELKAGEKLELLRDQIERDHAKGDDDDESLTKTIIKSLLPVLGQTMHQGTAQMRQASVKPPVQVVKKIAPRPATAQSAVQRNIPSSIAPKPSPVAPKPSPVAPKPSPMAPKPSPMAPKPSPVVSNRTDLPLPMKKISPVPDLSPETDVQKGDDMSVKDRIVEIMRDKMVSWLTTQPYRSNPSIATQETLSILAENEIGKDAVLLAFPNVNSLLETAHKEGLPKLADKWLNEYYANFNTPATQTHRTGTSDS